MLPSLTLSVSVFLLSALLHPAPGSTLCRNLCGAISVNYPFALDDGCGAPEYRNMFNCTGNLFFQTTSGIYRVLSIDYDKKTAVIYDPGMSTCTTLQPHKDFSMSEIQSVLIPPSPDTMFVLLNCSIDSPVLNHYRSLCTNFSGHSCDEMYGACPAFRIFRAFSGGFPACCFTDYTTVKFMSMNILDCSHYTTIYNAEDLKGVGPLDWSFGIKLSYTVPSSTCDRCQRSGGTCGFNTETEGFLCICSSTLNTTQDCGGGVVGNISGGRRLAASTLHHVLAFVIKKMCTSYGYLLSYRGFGNVM